jgi:hypothetical protein
MGKLAWFGVALSLVACGSDSKKKMIDAAVIDDAPIDTMSVANCGTVITAPTPSLSYKNLTDQQAFWKALLPIQVDGNPVYLQWEFYGGGPALTGTFDLTMGDQANYGTCEVCMHAYSDDGAGGGRDFFQVAGSLTLTKDPVADQELKASITGLQLQEVTIAGDFTSTPVAGGMCNTYADQTVDKQAAPDAWTCTTAKFSDGATCDCTCGAQDDDCYVPTNAIMGCPSSGQTCWAGACVTAPANDTCQNAAPLTIGTPKTGTTIGATRNYDAGFGCVQNIEQKGPDVAYSVMLTSGQQYTFTLSGLDATFDGSIELLGPSGGNPAFCDGDLSAGACVAGSDAALAGGTETFQYTATATDTYYVIVDSGPTGGPNTEGNFTLTVTSP